MNEQDQTKHRLANTMYTTLVLLGLVVFATLATIRFNILEAEQADRNEVYQLVKDESFRACVYRDSLGYVTVGYGHLVQPQEKALFSECITTQQGVALLRKDYARASQSVKTMYPWAKGEVRLVLTNMTFQLGAKGVSKFRITLACLEGKDYDCAAAELLNSRWARQTPYRVSRLTGRILALD